MNDEVENRLNRLTPRGVSPDLREKVLRAVAGELPSTSDVPLLGTSSALSRSDVQATPKATKVIAADTPFTSELCCRQSPASPWLRRATIAAAASLLMGIGLNMWVSRASERRLAEIFGPPPISQGAMEIAKTIEGITDAQTAQWVYRRLAVPPSPRAMEIARREYCRVVRTLIDELQVASKEPCHETPQKNTEMDRSHPGRSDGDSTDCQRYLRLDYGCTA